MFCQMEQEALIEIEPSKEIASIREKRVSLA